MIFFPSCRFEPAASPLLIPAACAIPSTSKRKRLRFLASLGVDSLAGAPLAFQQRRIASEHPGFAEVPAVDSVSPLSIALARPLCTHDRSKHEKSLRQRPLGL
jgi:hypothetical protein